MRYVPNSVMILLASTYGSASYGSGVYSTSSSPLVQIGPLTLPNTGAGWAVLIGATFLAIGGGLVVWLRQNRAKARRQDS